MQHSATTKPETKPTKRTLGDPFTALTRHAGSVAFVNEIRSHGHSGCSNAAGRMQQAIPLAKRGASKDTSPPPLNTGGATVRAPAAACTRAPRPNARSMHARRHPATPPAPCHESGLLSLAAVLGVVDRFSKDSNHKVGACDHGCAPHHAPHSTLPDGVEPPQATRCPVAAQLRLPPPPRTRPLSPRPTLPTTSPPPTRTGRKCIGPDAERARSCAPQINHTAQR